MRVRHIVLAVVVLLAGVLVGCDFIAPVSIDQRITDFQADLNKTTRTSAYLNFHPTLTKAYDALKDGSTITTLFPLPDGTGSSYVLTVTDESAPGTTGVLVTVTGGPTSYLGTHHLILVMETTAISDYRIVSLSTDDGAGHFLSTPQIE